MNRHRLFKHPGIQYLQRAVQRENQLKLLGCLCVWLFGTLVFFYGLQGSFLFSLLGFLVVVLSMRLGFPIFRRVHNEESRLFYVLRHQPRRIVWMYGLVTEHQPFGLSFLRSGVLYVKMIDGDEITVSIRPQKMRLVLRTLSRLLPHATCGYSQDKARQYRVQPDMLLRDSKQDR